MKMQDYAQMAENALNGIEADGKQFFAAIVKLLEVAHAHGLDAEAAEALRECGIRLETEEADDGKK